MQRTRYDRIMKQQVRGFSIRAGDRDEWLRPIPFWYIKMHERTVMATFGLTLEEIQKRGGLSPHQALAAVSDADAAELKRIQALTVEEAERQLRAKVQLAASLVASAPPSPCGHPERPSHVDARGIQKCEDCGKIINGVS